MYEYSRTYLISTLKDILTDVRNGLTDVDEASGLIKEKLFTLLEEPAIGISNLDATELYGGGV